MHIDAAWRKATVIISCYYCRKAGHKAPDCDLHFDICICMVNELQGFLDDKLAAALDIVKEEDDATVDEDKLEIQDLAICSE